MCSIMDWCSLLTSEALEVPLLMYGSWISSLGTDGEDFCGFTSRSALIVSLAPWPGWRCSIMAESRSCSFFSWISSCETICTWTRVCAVDRSFRMCSLSKWTLWWNKRLKQLGTWNNDHLAYEPELLERVEMRLAPSPPARAVAEERV